MALQFPSDPITYPEYTYGDVTYVWDTDRWVVESSGSGGGSTSNLQDVTDVGNNTTNGITIDTDKIALNADGSATFAGRVTAAGYDLASLPTLL